jgi:hypothetical protein
LTLDLRTAVIWGGSPLHRIGEDSRNSKECGKVKRERALQIILAIVGLLFVALLHPLYTDLAHYSWQSIAHSFVTIIET